MQNKKTDHQKRGTSHSDSESFDAWFERELAGVHAQLDALHMTTTPPPKAATQRRTEQPKPSRKQEPATTTPPDTKPPAPEARPAAPAAPRTEVPRQPAAPPPSLPTGSDLSDPKNFGLLPPVAELERGTADADQYRQRLSGHIAFATRVLHTSGVPAAVWREWRTFEKAARERLRDLAAAPR